MDFQLCVGGWFLYPLELEHSDDKDEEKERNV